MDLTPGEAPADTPAVVEPAGGRGLSIDGRDAEILRAADDPIPAGFEKKNLRMDLLLKYMAGGDISGSNYRVLNAREFTHREKAYLMRHEWFRDVFDARLFDLFMGVEEMDAGTMRLMDLVGRRVGLSRMITQTNIQINNGRGRKRGGATKIRVKR